MDKKIIKSAVAITGVGVVDKIDGELFTDQDGIFITNEEQQRRKVYFERRAQARMERERRLVQENNRLREQIGLSGEEKEKIKGRFIWGYFVEQQKMFPGLKSEDIARLVYLATYIRFNTNKIEIDREELRFEDINDIMRLNHSTCRAWVAKMIQYKYIEHKNGAVYINKSFFKQGVIGELGESKAVRLFIGVLRELYESLSPAEHYKMGLCIELIPYINPYFNCLAKNKQNIDQKNIKPMKFRELAAELGYSIKKCRRLGNEILGVRFGKEQKRLVMFVAFDDLKPENMVLTFNPNLFYGGKKSEYEKLAAWF